MKDAFKNFIVNLLFIFIATNTFGQDTLKTVQYDMSNCIRLNIGENKRITNRENLNSLIRNDASEERCLKKLKDFDLDHFSLLGINLNSGYCGEPLGLNFTTVKVDSEKKYILEISYYEPIGVCRALSSYFVWVMVPALTEGYDVEFVISPRVKEI